MLGKAEVLKTIEKHRSRLQGFDVEAIGVFGSVVTGESKQTSDVDILVEFNSPTFDKYMELKFFLERILQRKVDLVLRDALKERLKERILQEVTYAQCPGTMKRDQT